MVTNQQSTHVEGERLVRERLAAMGYQILPSAERGISFEVAIGHKSLPVKVKTIRYGNWQFTASALMDVSVSKDGIQTVHGRKVPPNPDLLCVLVKLDEAEFFVLTLGELYDTVCDHHEAWLNEHGGRRPRKPESMHTSASPLDLASYAEDWDLFRRRLGA